MISDWDNFMNRNIRILNSNPMSNSTIFPANSDICITRLPVRKVDGYTEAFINNFIEKIKSSMTDGGIVFLICYAPVECKSRPFEISKKMVEAGFTHIDNIVVEKTWVPGRRMDNMLTNSHEYVLYFCKGSAWTIDKEALEDFFQIDKTDEFLGNTWLIDTGALEQSIPICLAEALIRMTNCLPGALIIDPFMENDSTLQVAMKLGYSFWGCETDKKRIKKYEKIMNDYINKGDIYGFIREN